VIASLWTRSQAAVLHRLLFRDPPSTQQTPDLTLQQLLELYYIVPSEYNPSSLAASLADLIHDARSNFSLDFRSSSCSCSLDESNRF